MAEGHLSSEELGGRSFRTPKDEIVVIPGTKQRKSPYYVAPNEHKTFNYAHQEKKDEAEEKADRAITAELARTKLAEFAEFHEGNSRSVGTGVEIEGVLYDKQGNLLTVHEGGITFDDAPPEMYDAQMEVVTGPIEDNGNTSYPSSATEIAHSVEKAVAGGIHIAKVRNGYIAFSSVPEGGKPDQLRVTAHDKVRRGMRTGLGGVHPEAPSEVVNIVSNIGLKDLIPYHGTHVHTSTPMRPNGKFDARAGYAAGVVGLTQMAQVESYMLFNTRDYMGTRLDKIKDVRSIVKRSVKGGLATEIPDNAHDFVAESIAALEEGDTHELSRYPIKGQHDRRRFLKEFGTTESVVGAANPDLRLILAHTYFEQLMRVLSYKALYATGGDESKVISYLQNDYQNGKYGYLFEQLPTLEGTTSNFQQDIKFNTNGFDAEHNGKTYRDQMQDMREIAQQLGEEFPAFRTQAQIVDHVFAKVSQPAERGMGLAQYLDINSGMKGGIVSDYKLHDIAENIRAQAQGTEKQVKALEQIGDDDAKLMAFFGIAA